MEQQENDFPDITYLKLAWLFTPLILADLRKDENQENE